MKKAIIVHCWEGYPQYAWYPSVRTELINRGYNVDVPFFSDEFPIIDRWITRIEKFLDRPDRETILIGHSLGAVAILKYLQKLPNLEKVGLVVLVSGFVNDMGFIPLRNFFKEPLDFDKIKDKAERFVVISSGDDPYVKSFHSAILCANLNARLIWKNNGGHFTTNDDRRQLKNFPEIVQIVDSWEGNVVFKKTDNKFKQYVNI